MFFSGTCVTSHTEAKNKCGNKNECMLYNWLALDCRYQEMLCKFSFLFLCFLFSLFFLNFSRFVHFSIIKKAALQHFTSIIFKWGKKKILSKFLPIPPQKIPPETLLIYGPRMHAWGLQPIQIIEQSLKPFPSS